MAEILYGIRKSDGKIISISNILNSPDREKLRGGQCNCICPHPNCGSPLDAKLGHGGKEPHFAHQKGYERCDITYANETALHLMAKEIIAEERRFAVPTETIKLEDVGINDIPYEAFDDVPVYRAKKGGIFDCTNVELEKRVSDIVPDVVAYTAKGQCLIEIFVTHRVPPEKEALIKNLHLPTIEINLSDFKDKEVTREELRDVLLKPNKRIRWIYYKGQEDALVKARKYYRNHPKVYKYLKEEAIAKKWKEEQRQKFDEEQTKRTKQRELAREAARSKQKELREKKQQEILNFNYNQEETSVYDLENYKIAKCMYCGKTMRAHRMRIVDSRKSNLRACNWCYLQQKIKSNNS